jgi:hypothetical protein
MMKKQFKFVSKTVFYNVSTFSFLNFSALQQAISAFINFINNHSLNSLLLSNVAHFGMSGKKFGTPFRALTATCYKNINSLIKSFYSFYSKHTLYRVVVSFSDSLYFCITINA